MIHFATFRTVFFLFPGLMNGFFFPCMSSTSTSRVHHLECQNMEYGVQANSNTIALSRRPTLLRRCLDPRATFSNTPSQGILYCHATKKRLRLGR